MSKKCVFLVVFFRVGGYGVLSSSGRAAGVLQRSFWGQFSGVPGIADSHRLSHSDFFWDLYFSGSHYRQFLSGLHHPLFPAAQIQKDRWRGGRGLRVLNGQNGSHKLSIMQWRPMVGKEVNNLISMTKEPWIRPLCDYSDSQPSPWSIVCFFFLYLNTNDWVEP